MGAGLALAMTMYLYPKIDIDAVDGFADGKWRGRPWPY
jgi:hypothetical protein